MVIIPDIKQADTRSDRQKSEDRRLRIIELEAELEASQRAYREQKERADHEEKTRMDWQGMYHVAAERASAGYTPPLMGNWRHSNGVICCGTLRIANVDIDTNPSEEFKSELLGWICKTLNAAQGE